MTDDNSFLHEAQQEGRASSKMEISDLDKAIKEITHVIDEEVVASYKNTDESDWGKTTMATYCHDCRDIVPAGIGKTLRGNPRTVCGNCHSKKISMGREDALRGFYHLRKKEEESEEKK